LDEVAAGVVQPGDDRAGELGTARSDALVVTVEVVGEGHGGRDPLLKHRLLIGGSGRMVVRAS
jgi:hypothetical protein